MTITLAEIIESAAAGDSTIDFLPIASEVIARSGIRAEYVWEEKLRSHKRREDKLANGEIDTIRVIKVHTSRELRELVADICEVVNPDHLDDNDYLHTPTNLLRAIATHWNQTDEARKNFRAPFNAPIPNRNAAARLAREIAEAHIILTNQVARIAA